jgi:hypothetical protein
VVGCSNVAVVEIACRASIGTFCATRSLGPRAQAPCTCHEVLNRAQPMYPEDDIGRPTPHSTFSPRHCKSVVFSPSLAISDLTISGVRFVLAMASSSTPKVPASILIVGSGAFGLSTAWALCRNPQYKDTTITVVDRQPFPTPDGSSVSSKVLPC